MIDEAGEADRLGPVARDVERSRSGTPRSRRPKAMFSITVSQGNSV
jgi:hypothetical protein